MTKTYDCEDCRQEMVERIEDALNSGIWGTDFHGEHQDDLEAQLEALKAEAPEPADQLAYCEDHRDVGRPD